MENRNILLICGSGASSGFMAANMRKEIAGKDLNFTIKARSESEIENYIDETDVIMVGPHLAYLLDDLEEDYKDEDVTIILMEASYYSTLDGKAAVEHMLKVLK